MTFDFEMFLVLATAITGIVALVDLLFFARHRATPEYAPKIIEYARAFFPVFLIVLLLRSFLFEPFRIPSGSLEPTLLPGDFVAASKFAYGLRLPVLHDKIMALGEPEVGDIAVFRSVQNAHVDFIKRVIGVPGDKIAYKDKILYINGVEQPQKKIGEATDYDSWGNEMPVDVYEENLLGVKHKIYINPARPARDGTYVVPAGEYFMMGDNRDNSDDSRYWGFLPEENLVGKAVMIWLSWDGQDKRIRWSRMGTKLGQLG